MGSTDARDPIPGVSALEALRLAIGARIGRDPYPLEHGG
jgi:hypothetical protein